MKANELRIGNYVIDEDGKIIRLQSVDDLRYYICYDPIPLTEEWLLRLGFDERGFKWVGDNWMCLSGYVLEIGDLDSSTSGMMWHAPCRYVNQLQNLYFALTGEELKNNLE